MSANNKPRKVPFYANGQKRRGKQGCAKDVANLVTYAKALIACKQHKADGLGFALLPGCGVTALDFDHCVKDGNVDPDVESLVLGTYAEISPSGTGVRAFFAGDLGDHKDLKSDIGFEVFSSVGFVTVTGDTLPSTELLDNDIAPVSSEIEKYCCMRFGKNRAHTTVENALLAQDTVVGLSSESMTEILDVLDPAMPYPDWINVGMALHHELGVDGLGMWDAWSSTADNYPGFDALEKHWNSFGHNQSAPVTARSLLKLAKKAGIRINPDLAAVSEFENINEASDSAEARFVVVNAEDFADCNPTSWLIKNVLPKADLGVLFGESGSGKSFFASDTALSLALGKTWRGNKVKQCRVVYVAAEGGSGFRKRLKAYEQHNGINLMGVPFGVIHVAPNFSQKTDALDIAKAIKKWGGADLVIIDTFAQVMPGANENAGEDVGKALAHFRGLNRALGAMVLLVHHSGKDASKGARGWSGLRAAADVEFEVIKTDSCRITRITKQKDGDDQGEFGFSLEVVPLGMDEDGDVVTSCVVVEAAIEIAEKSQMPTGRWTNLIISVVNEFGLAQSTGIEVDAVIAECLVRTDAPEGKRDTRKQLLRRALKALCTGDGAPYFEEDGCLEIL